MVCSQRSYSLGMTISEARKILNRILKDPNLADQFTEEEIEELEYIASQK